MAFKNFYTATDIKPGDEFIATVKVMVQYDGSYRVYRCLLGKRKEIIWAMKP